MEIKSNNPAGSGWVINKFTVFCPPQPWAPPTDKYSNCGKKTIRLFRKTLKLDDMDHNHSQFRKDRLGFKFNTNYVFQVRRI